VVELISTWLVDGMACTEEIELAVETVEDVVTPVGAEVLNNIHKVL